MRFAVILKTYADTDKTDRDYGSMWSLFPNDYPLLVREEEHDNLSMAEAANVGKTVLSIRDYVTMQRSLLNLHADLQVLMRDKSKEIEARDLVIR